MCCTLQAPPSTQVEPEQRKVPLKRRDPGHSQRIRRGVQLLFLALNVWIGIEFILFVRFYESGGRTLRVQRPPGVEGWLPIASLMNLKVFLTTGEVPPHHASGMFLLAAFLVMSLLLRKSFCSWLCPVGTVSELLWKLGRGMFGGNYRLPRWLDIGLRSLKYILLGLFVYAVGSMSAMAIRAFLDGPYGVIADVKMLNFFRYISLTSAVVIGILILASVFIQNFWCRFLCPYGALLGLLSRFSPVRIRRNADPCTDCGKCTQVCPSLLPVDRLVTIRSPECTGCYECVAACPAAGALAMTTPGTRRFPTWAMAAGLAIIFFGFIGFAQWGGYWHTSIPDAVYFDFIPRAHEFSHP